MIMILARIAVHREVAVAPIVAGTAWVPDREIHAIAIDVAMINQATILKKTFIAAAATATVINFKVEEDQTARWEITRN